MTVAVGHFAYILAVFVSCFSFFSLSEAFENFFYTKTAQTHTQTDQLLNPGVVSWWADGHLDDSGRDENDKTERGDVLPKVEIDDIRSET